MVSYQNLLVVTVVYQAFVYIFLIYTYLGFKHIYIPKRQKNKIVFVQLKLLVRLRTTQIIIVNFIADFHRRRVVQNTPYFKLVWDIYIANGLYVQIKKDWHIKDSLQKSQCTKCSESIQMQQQTVETSCEWLVHGWKSINHLSTQYCQLV